MTETQTVETTTKKRGRPRGSQAVAAPIAAQPVALSSDTAALIDAITKASRDPAINIEKMQFLLDTRRKLLDEEAEREWINAMAHVQAELGPVSKDLENPQTRSRYSSLAALDAAIRPHYTAHGFSITYDSEPSERGPEWINVVCYVERGRHSRRRSVPMPCDGLGPKGTPVMSRTHSVGSALSYGRRYALCLALNLVTADDDGNRASAKPAVGARTGAGGGGIPMVGPPPPSSAGDRASHTRQAIAAATTHTRAGLMQALEASTDAAGRIGLLSELRQLMQKAKVGEGVVCEVFSVESLDDLTSEQLQIALKKVRKNLE